MYICSSRSEKCSSIPHLALEGRRQKRRPCQTKKTWTSTTSDRASEVIIRTRFVLFSEILKWTTWCVYDWCHKWQWQARWTMHRCDSRLRFSFSFFETIPCLHVLVNKQHLALINLRHFSHSLATSLFMLYIRRTFAGPFACSEVMLGNVHSLRSTAVYTLS